MKQRDNFFLFRIKKKEDEKKLILKLKKGPNCVLEYT